MIDRLDVAFDEFAELEKNALRALFKAYRDIRVHEQVEIKIFLRTDIWKRITEEGFREATHLSRDIVLDWDKPSLQNLIVRRLLNNDAVIDYYKIEKDLGALFCRAADRTICQNIPGSGGGRRETIDND